LKFYICLVECFPHVKKFLWSPMFTLKTFWRNIFHTQTYQFLLHLYMYRSVICCKVQKGLSESVYRSEGQTTQWPKEKVQKYKQRSTKHTYKTKDRVTRTPLKFGGEFRCSGRVAVPSPLVTPSC
jgi:hypothetical protein